MNDTVIVVPGEQVGRVRSRIGLICHRDQIVPQSLALCTIRALNQIPVGPQTRIRPRNARNHPTMATLDGRFRAFLGRIRIGSRSVQRVRSTSMILGRG